jgi:hypothetical protein
MHLHWSCMDSASSQHDALREAASKRAGMASDQRTLRGTLSVAQKESRQRRSKEACGREGWALQRLRDFFVLAGWSSATYHRVGTLLQLPRLIPTESCTRPDLPSSP